MKKAAIAIIFMLAPYFASALPCNVSISVESSHEIFENSNKIEFQSILSNKSFEYVIEYWIEDSGGKVIKRKINTTNTNKKSFTPKNIGSDIIIKSRIAELACEDIDFEDNFAEKRIFLKSKNQNLTHKEVKVSFTIDKDLQKLRDFAEQLENPLNRTEYRPKEQTSTNENNKIRKTIPYFLVTLTTIISIVLIWRR